MVTESSESVKTWIFWYYFKCRAGGIFEELNVRSKENGFLLSYDSGK